MLLILASAAKSNSRPRLLHDSFLTMRKIRTSPSAALGWGSGKGGGSHSRRPPPIDERQQRRQPSSPPPPPRSRPRQQQQQPPSTSSSDPFSNPSSYSSNPFSFEHTGRFFATCHPGLEHFVAEELLSPAIGASGVEPGRGGVHFRGSAATCYAANLWLRCAIRVLHLVGEGSIAPSRYRGRGGERGGDRLYALTRRACDWASLLPPSPSSSSSPGTISVEARVGACTDLAGSRLAATVVRDAVCDAVRDATGRRPPPPPSSSSSADLLQGAPSAIVDLPIFVAAHRDVVWLYRDTSGESLHRRGYRTNSRVHAAALNESAAAGVLAAAGWLPRVDAAERAFVLDPDVDNVVSLVDPMCGSGTLLIEAALAATRTAPGLTRTRWPFLRWRDFDQGLWRGVRERVAQASRRDGVVVGGGSGSGGRKRRLFYLAGRDCHEGALALARRGAFEAGVDHLIDFDLGGCAGWEPRVPLSASGGPEGDSSGGGFGRPTLVVTNPPWGRRLLGATSRFDSPVFAQEGRRGRGNSNDYNSGGRDRRHRRAAVDDDGERVRPWYDDAGDGGGDGGGLDWDSSASPLPLSTAAAAAAEDDDDDDEFPSTSPSASPSSSSSSSPFDPEASEQALEGAWRDLGKFLRESASPGEAYVVCGNRDASRFLRMRASKKWPLTAGGADVRILKYDVLPPLPKQGEAEGSGRGNRERDDHGVVVR